MGRPLAWLGAVVLFAACGFSNEDLTGRPCPCLEGSFVCDTATQRCVPVALGGTGPDGDGGSTAAGFSIHVAPDAVRLGLGKTGSVHVTVERQPGFQAPLVVGALDPPPLVTVPPVTIPPETSEVDVAISAATDAKAGSAVDITLAATGAGQSATATLKAQIVGNPGDVDTSFGTNGILRIQNRFVTRLVEQSDGKILAWERQTLNVLRFNADGSVDNAFGTQGKATPTVNGGNAVGRDLALLPDGRIALVGAASISNGPLFAALMTSNGTLDSTFGTGGTFYVASPSQGSGNTVAVQPDGKILIAGTTYPASPSQLIAVRLKVNGTLDATFGGSGVVTKTFGINATAYSAVLQGDGKLVLGGNTFASADQAVLVRYLPSGALDPSFGNAGVVLDTPMEYCSEVALQTSGHILCLNLLSGNGSTARFDSAGTKDMSFGTAGELAPNVSPTSYDKVLAFALQADDKIVTAGELRPASSPRQAVLRRWSPSGTPDATFAPATIASGQSVNALIILRDGRALVSLADPNGLDSLLCRIWL